MRKILLVTVPLTALMAACNIVNQAQQHTVIVGTVLATPPVTLSPAALGIDAGGFDASFPADSGFSFDGGGFTLPGQTGAVVYLGTLTSVSSLNQPPTPLSDATVTLTAVGGSQVNLPGDGGGAYALTSLQDSAFQYQSGATYDFTAVEGGNTYIGEVTQAPDVEQISEFHPAAGYVSLAAGSPFSFHRPDPPAGQGRNLGFVNVFPVDANGNPQPPTYTNIPQTPLDFLKLIADPTTYKQTSVAVPGTAFPQPQTTYVIVFEGVKPGGPKSDNLFLGSALLAGTADIGVIRTQ